MARGPFQGNYQPNVRPTIAIAPDAMVFINGESDLIGCPNCKRKFDLGKYITSIQVNLDVDSVPGSASISLSVPRHVIDDFYFNGRPVVTTMMEVEIYSKGYYTLEGLPQYYPLFWGLITEVGSSFSGGEHTVTIQCADILKWWELCRMNINPAFTGASAQLGRSIFGNTLYGTNVYDMIFTLSNMAFGDVMVATGSLTSLIKEQAQAKTFRAAMGDIMQYWSSRFTRIRSNLLLYGVNGVAIRGDSIAHAYKSGKAKPGQQSIANAVRNANGGTSAAQLIFDPTDPGVTAFRTQFPSAGEVNFWQSEYQTKLEIANSCKEAVGFEFYMDVTGDIVFKPPFYNLDILSNKPISWIQDIDILDWDFTDSESEVVTQLTIEGNFGGNIDYGFGPEITPFTSVTDYHLLRKYGWRSHTYPSEFMGDTMRMFYHGLDILDRINSKRNQATITIPHRPELRLGFPIYLAPLDEVWYIRGLNHNIQFGGRTTTSLSLTARRQKFIAPKGISTLDTGAIKSKSPTNKNSQVVVTQTDVQAAPPTIRQLAQTSFKLDLGEAATLPPINVDPNNPASLDPYQPLILRHPKTGKVVGYPNVVMVYSRPYDPRAANSAVSGEKNPGTNTIVKKENKAQVKRRQEANKEAEDIRLDPDKYLEAENKYSHNRYSYGLNSAGVYVYAYDTGKSITQFALMPSKNISVTKDGQVSNFSDTGIKLENPNTMVRPVSDERGFEVIGHFRYGRGVSLRDGSLIYNPGKSNTSVQVGVQLALSGDLLSTLNAQSRGITAVTTVYENPADTIARLTPDDVQSAAALVTGQDGLKSPQFVTTVTNFVDVAPLGSPEDKGVPLSVEASQLSRALTLAEMTIRSELVPGDPECSCMSGRDDLAFINVGYQISSITQSSSTSGESLQGSNTGSGPVNFSLLSEEDLTHPLTPIARSSDVINRVEQYLATLYKALDTPHQQLENSLRGDPSGLEPNIRKRPDLFTISSQDQDFGNFTPPFSSPNRSALGDPVATAQQAVSSKSDLSQAFSSFGSNLKKNQRKAQLTQEISGINSNLVSLNRRLQDATPTPGTTRITGPESPDDLQRRIDAEKRSLVDKETELSQLG
jgi:hypothetical protein